MSLFKSRRSAIPAQNGAEPHFRHFSDALGSLRIDRRAAPSGNGAEFQVGYLQLEMPCNGVSPFVRHASTSPWLMAHRTARAERACSWLAWAPFGQQFAELADRRRRAGDDRYACEVAEDAVGRRPQEREGTPPRGK